MTHEIQRIYVEHELADICGNENVLAEESDRFAYALDYMWVPRMWVDRGRTPPIPDFVVLPGNSEEVARVIRLANIHKIPVIPWGGGSGSQGGIVPLYGGITLDLKRLNRIKEINEVAQTVTAEAGINGFDLECALNERGYTLAHIPASIHSATLGGYIACRGSGVLSSKYGKIEDICMSLRAVLPTGELVETLPVPNHASGPGILQLFIGAEGTFGVVTEATCRIERLPEDRRFSAFLFDSFHDGLEAGRTIMLERLQPSVMRLYDEPETQKRIRKILDLDLKEKSYMVVGLEGSSAMLDVQERRVRKICDHFHAEELDNSNAWEWWNHRYNFYFPPDALDLPSMFGTMDTLCTFDRMEDLYNTKKRTLEERYARWDLQYIAHLSHWYPWGVMIYDRFIVEQPPDDAEEALKLHNDIWNVAVRTSIACGGVLNEHHGVGLKLSRLVREQYGPSFKVIEGLKSALDPNFILNPGKMGFGPTVV